MTILLSLEMVSYACHMVQPGRVTYVSQVGNQWRKDQMTLLTDCVFCNKWKPVILTMTTFLIDPNPRRASRGQIYKSSNFFDNLSNSHSFCIYGG